MGINTDKKKLKIVIDARPAEKESFGIARYAYELIKALQKIDNVNDYILLVNSDRLSGLIRENENFHLYKISSKWMGFAEQFELPLVLLKIKPDLFHATSSVVPYFVPCKTIISIMDLIHLKFPLDYSWFHRLYYRIIIGKAVSKAKKIITISNSSKKDIIGRYKVDPKKIIVTYLSASSDFYPLDNNLKEQYSRQYKLPDPYILTVGSEKPHKNIISTVMAFKILKEKFNIKHKLIIIGRVDDQVNGYIEAFLRNAVVVRTGIDTNELNVLYNFADIFVFPSLYEGFGLPVLEAMACQTPVISSNISSIPEIVGEAGILINPSKISE